MAKEYFEFSDRSFTPYTSSRFVQLKGNCPICNGEHKSCKQNGELIHCRSHSEPPQGYDFVGEDKIGFAMYAPARDKSQPYDHEASRAKRETRLAKQARQREQALKALPSLEERDRKIKSYPQKLNNAHNADLIRRGLTQDEINFATSNHWLFGGLQGGYGIAAYDSISGLLCGAQRANDDRTKKYTWGVFTGQNPLRETGENPLFVWVSPDFDNSKPYEKKYCEGALKSLIRALLEWRTNPQIIVIGAAGGRFIGETGKGLERVLSAYPDATSHTFLPDADSQNVTKLNLPSAYGGLAEALPQVKFADWGHWQQTKEGGGKDCDETYNTDAFNGYVLRSPQDWLSFFDEIRKEKEFEEKLNIARQRLEVSDKLTHDIEITHDEFKALTPDTIKALTGNARDIAINAFTGAGKTELAAKIIANYAYAIAPFHRKALAQSGSQRLGLTYRTDCDRNGKDLITSEGYVTKLGLCNEAMIQLISAINGLLGKDAFAFGDEFDQQLESLALSSTHSKDGRRRLHQRTFADIFKMAVQTLIASADLTDYQINQFHKMTGRKPFVIKVKTVKKGYKAFMYQQFADFWLKFNEARRQGKRILVLCTRKEDAKFLQFAYGAVAVHADNSGDYRELLDTPDPWLQDNKPILMAVSPVFGTGFSITHDAFDCVFGWFKADNIPAKGLIQFLNRYRLPVERHIYCDYSSGRYDGLTSDELFKTRLAKAKAQKVNEGEASFINADDPYFHYKAETNWSLAHLSADLFVRLERDVEMVEYVRSQLSEDDRKAVTKELNEKLKEYRATYPVTVFEARNLCLSEYLALKDESNLSEGDRLAVAKFEIADWSCLTPDQLTLERVQRDRKGKKRKAVGNLEMQSFPQIAKALDKASVEKQTKHGEGIAHQDISHHALRVEALDKLGIDEPLAFILSGNSWSAITPQVETFAQKLIDNREALAKIGIRLTCAKNAPVNAVFGALLKNYFGLETVRSQLQSPTDKDKKYSVYRLDTKDLALTKTDLMARLHRNIERYGELKADPQKAFVAMLYGSHTPFDNSDIQKVCDQPQTITVQVIEPVENCDDEWVEVEPIADPPNIEAAIAPSPIAQTNIKEDLQPIAIAPSNPQTKNEPTQLIDPYELRLRAYQQGWDGSPYSLMRYA
jgi:hypothetical protein